MSFIGVMSLLFLWCLHHHVDAFLLLPLSYTRKYTSSRFHRSSHFTDVPKLSSALIGLSAIKCSSLPTGLSPFEKSIAKGLDIQGNIRKLASQAIDQALANDVVFLEVDFPPFVGGDQSKTQFDDYDNLQELNANRDWCVQLAPNLKSPKEIWLIFPDDKECELAKNAWTGQLYRKASKFTSIRAAVLEVGGVTQYRKAWGSSFASAMNRITGGDGILADASALDTLTESTETGVAANDRLHLVCQPGNGGPVEDWINVERLHNSANSARTCVVNGALDKVRDGYYPGVFFPALARTVPFYKQFEPVFILKPLTAKGLYGWLYRVYPEPWQVILQVTQQQDKRTGRSLVKIQDIVALVQNQRPTYDEAVQALVSAALKTR